MTNKTRVRQKIRGMLSSGEYIEKAIAPELTYKPDFMANVENILMFIEVVSITSSSESDWTTLRLIEHLFETKLFFGNKACFHIIVLKKEKWKHYCIELLENFFDKVTYDEEIFDLQHLYIQPKEQNFKLWDLEREYQKSRTLLLKEFTPTERFLGKFQYANVDDQELESHVFNNLNQISNYVSSKYPLTNLKSYYISEDLKLKFYFDFFANNHVIEVASFKRLGARTLQDLLIKARLVRYRKINGEIERIGLNFKMILLINGFLDGPKYDCSRYLRMLHNAGWEICPADNIAILQGLMR